MLCRRRRRFKLYKITWFFNLISVKSPANTHYIMNALIFYFPFYFCHTGLYAIIYCSMGGITYTGWVGATTIYYTIEGATYGFDVCLLIRLGTRCESHGYLYVSTLFHAPKWKKMWFFFCKRFLHEEILSCNLWMCMEQRIRWLIYICVPKDLHKNEHVCRILWYINFASFFLKMERNSDLYLLQ